MKVMVLGGGGREHALVRALAHSPLVDSVLVAPGNGGTDDPTLRSRNVSISAEDAQAVLRVVRSQDVHLVVVGPEAPLVVGVADALRAEGVPCFGPSAAAARLEGSKRFAKGFMRRWNIPTAEWSAFTEADRACAYILERPYPVVIKASGLAAGKGVWLPDSAEEACQLAQRLLRDRELGEAGAEIVVEQRLSGVEVSCLAFCDGVRAAPMPPAQDHKRAFDGDQGPNTGGMGAYAPAPWPDAAGLEFVRDHILQRTLDGLSAEDIPLVGVLYAGLMLTNEGPRVLEFNVRFGDPEAQVLLPLLDSDLAQVLMDCATGRLKPAAIRWRPGAAAAVVAASAGYPGSYSAGRPIQGLDAVSTLPETWIDQAGTRRSPQGLLTHGGRVLAAVGRGADLKQAIQRAYAGLDCLSFEGMFARRDIGWRALTPKNQEPA